MAVSEEFLRLVLRLLAPLHRLKTSSADQAEPHSPKRLLRYIMKQNGSSKDDAR